jgi:2'-5' RNA ligase
MPSGDPLAGENRPGSGSKTHATAVVLIPPGEVWEPIQAIRGRHDRQVRRWMPHVTLLYPFRPREAFPEAERGFRTALRGIAPFELSLSRFQWFSHGASSYTLWLAPEPTPPLLDLHRACLEAAPECDDTARHRQGFQPHLSVGQFRGPREALSRLLDSLQESWRPLRFIARHVSLIWRGAPPDDVFRVDREISLSFSFPPVDRQQ